MKRVILKVIVRGLPPATFTSLAGQVARRLLNTSPCLVAEGAAEAHLEKFCYKMMVSGYNHHEREIIMMEGVARYRNICRLAAEGSRPMYRTSSWMKKERAVEKVLKKKTWYGKQHKAVLFVQSTPGGVLKAAVDKVVRKSGLKVKVVEKGGKKIQSLLMKSNIADMIQCGEPNCVICLSGGKGPCNKEGVCYRVTCLKCLDVGKKSEMFGETGRTGRIRCGEHWKALLDKKKSNLWEHQVAVHGGEEARFKFDVISSHTGDPLGRQLTEAMNIQMAATFDDYSLNDKGEWVRPAGLEIEVRRM